MNSVSTRLSRSSRPPVKEAGGIGIPAVEAGLRALLDAMEECPAQARVCVVEIASVGATGREARNRTIEPVPAALLRGVIGGPTSRTQAEATVAGWYYVLHATVLEGKAGELGQHPPGHGSTWSPAASAN